MTEMVPKESQFKASELRALPRVYSGFNTEKSQWQRANSGLDNFRTGQRYAVPCAPRSALREPATTVDRGAGSIPSGISPQISIGCLPQFDGDSLKTQDLRDRWAKFAEMLLLRSCAVGDSDARWGCGCSRFF